MLALLADSAIVCDVILTLFWGFPRVKLIYHLLVGVWIMLRMQCMLLLSAGDRLRELLDCIRCKLYCCRAMVALSSPHTILHFKIGYFMNIRNWISGFAGFVSAVLLSCIGYAADTVSLSQSNDSVAVTLNGKEFTTYRFAKSQPKPYFFPIKSGDNAMLTRPIVGADYKGDHPHHKGIWVSVDEINEIKFWAEKGKIENRGVELLVPEGNPAKLRVTNHWLDSKGGDVLIETTTISIFANRMLAYDISFKMVADEVNFKDTKEGLLGFRVAESQREDKGDGKVSNADGKKGTKECWGQRSAWVDYTGSVGNKPYGVTIFDHPGNFRPSRYHVRDYGLFSISPFGESAYSNGREPAVNDVFKKQSELRLRYAIYFHNGFVTPADLNALAKTFTSL